MTSVLKYVGRMSKSHIKPYIADDINTYVEPFSGSFNCAFNLIEDGFKGKVVFNDKDLNVYNFWLCVKTDLDRLLDNIDRLIDQIRNSYRTPKNEIKRMDTSKLDIFELAAYEYVYRVINHFNGALYLFKDEPYKLGDFMIQHEMLQNCDLNNLDYSAVIQKYDSENTLFLLDPPFNIKNVTSYYRDVEDFDHAKLKDILSNTKGKWLLRYNKDDYIMQLYSGYNTFGGLANKAFAKDVSAVYFTNLEVLPEVCTLQ